MPPTAPALKVSVIVWWVTSGPLGPGGGGSPIVRVKVPVVVLPATRTMYWVPATALNVNCDRATQKLSLQAIWFAVVAGHAECTEMTVSKLAAEQVLAVTVPVVGAV